MTSIGIIIIGRNEGQRLTTCLESVRNTQLQEGATAIRIADVIYVDSNSTDDSVETARSLGAQVVELDPAIPFTAARARNAGAEALLRAHPEVELLQFLDGDTELHPRWLPHAAGYLSHNKHVAVVCGRRRERFPEASIYNLLADMEWDTAIGQAQEFGGDAMIRATVFIHLAGYTASFIAGEEPEFAARLRKAGHSIVRLNHEMTLHDMAMTRFRQWWKRNFRYGHALAHLAHTHGGAPLYFYRQAWRSTIMWAAAIPLAILALALVLSWWALVLIPLAYCYLWVRVIRYRLKRGDDRTSAFTYAGFTVIAKFPQFFGLMHFYKNLLARKPSRIIEYKSAAPQPTGNPAAAAVGNT